MDTQTGGIDRLSAMDDTDDVEVTEVEVTRAKIEQTRSEMGDTIEAIKDKLNPQMLAQQAKDTVHDVTTDLAERAKETVHAVTSDVVQQAKENLPEMTANMAHKAVGSAVDTAKEAVGDAVGTAKEAVGSAVDSAKDAGSSVLEVIQRNPVPAALIGLGLSWLYMSTRSNSSTPRLKDRRYTYRERETYNQPGRYDSLRQYDRRPQSDEQHGTLNAAREAVGDAVGSAKEAVGSAVSTAKGAVGDALHTAKEAAGDAAHTARDAGSSVVEMVQQNPIPAALMATGLGWMLMGNRGAHSSRSFADRSYAYDDQRSYDTMPRYGEAVGIASRSDEAWRQGHDRSYGSPAHGSTDAIQRTLQQNPVAAGAVALGLGAALGLLLPETRQENEWMGEAKERVVEKAQETAQDIGMKVQIVAEEAVEAAKGTAKQEAKNLGLSSK
jgi:hypothetical protein